MQRYKKSGRYAREYIIYLFDSQFIHHRALKKERHVFPVYCIEGLIPYMIDLHEPVIPVEALLEQCRRTPVVVEESYFPAVFRHDDENLVFLRFPVELLAYD